jgi:steroid delta-isomerase-like uncharacterized protein
MSLSANKATAVRLFEEVINQEKKAVIDEIIAADVMVHDPFMGNAQGLEAFKALINIFDTAFPHHRVRVEEVIADGDFVAVLHTHLATNTGPFLGMPPTGKSVVVPGIELFRIVDGKITEFWRKDEDANMLIQLGVLSVPTPS